MARANVISGPVSFDDTATFQVAPAVPPDSFGDREFDVTDPLQVENAEHRFKEKYSASGTAASVTLFLFKAESTGELEEFAAGLLGANVGGATVTFDLQKSTGGGAFATVLSATISFSNADAARTIKTATINTVAYVSGDQFQLVLTATVGGGTLGTGPWCQVKRKENPS